MQVSFRSIARLMVGCGLLAIVIITLLPIELRPLTVLPGNYERAASFLVFGILLALAFPRHLVAVAVPVVVAAGVLEVLQLLAPGRHPRRYDIVIKGLSGTTGVTIGFALNWIATFFLSRAVRSDSERPPR